MRDALGDGSPTDGSYIKSIELALGERLGSRFGHFACYRFARPIPSLGSGVQSPFGSELFGKPAVVAIRAASSKRLGHSKSPLLLNHELGFILPLEISRSISSTMNARVGASKFT